MGHSTLVWFADDGTEFKTQEEMLLHELLVLDSREIDAFLSTELVINARKHKEYKKVLAAWQQYIRSTQKLLPVVSKSITSLEGLFNEQTVEEFKPDNYVLGEKPVDETADIEASFKAATPI